MPTSGCCDLEKENTLRIKKAVREGGLRALGGHFGSFVQTFT